MNKKKFLSQVEKAYDAKKMEAEKIFLFNFLEFDFSYDKDNRQCLISCPVSEPMLNPGGILHGGIATYIADTAMGHLNTRFKDSSYVSLDLSTSFFNAISTGKLFATARYIKEGYKVSFMECVIKDENDNIICSTTGTFYRTKK